MPTAEARIETARASRYLAQLSSHAAFMAGHLTDRPGAMPTAPGDGAASPEVWHVESSDTHLTVTLSLGRFTVRATPDALTLRAGADHEKALGRIQELLAAHLEKIGRRDDLKVGWERVEEPAATDPRSLQY